MTRIRSVDLMYLFSAMGMRYSAQIQHVGTVGSEKRRKQLLGSLERLYGTKLRDLGKDSA